VNIIVQKYGGSSLSTPDKFLALAREIAKRSERDDRLVLVVSAMGDTTNNLVALVRELSSNPPAREMDMLLASGEQVSIALMAIALHKCGIDAISFTGSQVGIKTSPAHTRARVTGVDTSKVGAELDKGRVVIVAGFQGVTESNDVTTLGRGGSDISAVALAVALGAQRLEKFTDRDGVFTADPRIHPGAHRVPHLSYEEMLEMSHSGAKILHPRSVFFAMKYGLPILVRKSLGHGAGTLIDKGERRMEEPLLSGVTHDASVAKVSVYKVPDKPGMAYKILKVLTDQEIPVDMIVQSTTESAVNDISFTISKSDLNRAVELLQAASGDVEGIEVRASPNVALVSLVGLGIRTNAGIITRMFQALSEKQINIQMIATTDVRISCIIDEASVEEAVRTIAQTFDL